MKRSSKSNHDNQIRDRAVDCLVAPGLHVEGDHALNFITETLAMLTSTAPKLSDRHRIYLERSLSRRIGYGRPRHRSIPHLPHKDALVMSDNQWRAWRDVRGLFLAMRYAHERHAAIPTVA